MTEHLDSASRRCPACGTPAWDRKSGDYQELRDCPHCGAEKCCVCDMGDDCACIHCEQDEQD